MTHGRIIQFGITVAAVIVANYVMRRVPALQ